MKKGRGIEKKLNDWLSIIVFLSATYISFNVLNSLVYNVFGTAFFISALYGFISVYKGQKFIF